MQTNDTILLIITIFSLLTGIANKMRTVYLKLIWLVAFVGVAIAVYTAPSHYYWSSLEALFIASVSIVEIKDTTLHSTLILLAASTTFTHDVAAYFGVRQPIRQYIYAAAFFLHPFCFHRSPRRSSPSTSSSRKRKKRSRKEKLVCSMNKIRPRPSISRILSKNDWRAG